MLRWLWSPDGPHGHRMLPLGTAPGLQTNSAQCQSETDTTRKHRAVSSEILRKGRNHGWKTANKVLSFSSSWALPIHCFSDHVTVWPDPKPGTHETESDHCWVVCAPVVCRADGSRTLFILLFVLITFATSSHYRVIIPFKLRFPVSVLSSRLVSERVSEHWRPRLFYYR